MGPLKATLLRVVLGGPGLSTVTLPPVTTDPSEKVMTTCQLLTAAPVSLVIVRSPLKEGGNEFIVAEQAACTDALNTNDENSIKTLAHNLHLTFE